LENVGNYIKNVGCGKKRFTDKFGLRNATWLIILTSNFIYRRLLYISRPHFGCGKVGNWNSTENSQTRSWHRVGSSDNPFRFEIISSKLKFSLEKVNLNSRSLQLRLVYKHDPKLHYVRLKNLKRILYV